VLSLENFDDLFKQTLCNCTIQGDGRVEGLIKALEKRIFSHVSRSLFKKDRLMFGLHLVHGLVTYFSSFVLLFNVHFDNRASSFGQFFFVAKKN
jgi:hypothetical protein